jgi:hypothetical protein
MYSIDAIVGETIYLPCNISTHEHGDDVVLILWYREDKGTPIYRYELGIHTFFFVHTILNIHLDSLSHIFEITHKIFSSSFYLSFHGPKIPYPNNSATTATAKKKNWLFICVNFTLYFL